VSAKGGVPLNQRDLGEYPFVIVDALVIRVRKGGKRLLSVLMAIGISLE
jgi:transposase-like protein